MNVYQGAAWQRGNNGKRTAIFWLGMLLSLLLLTGCGDQQTKKKAERGLPAPDFTLTDLDGTTWKLSDLKGKLVFVNFWATWCPPCLEEMPSMEALNRRMDPDSFQMLAILYNDRPDFARDLAGKLGSTFPMLVDESASSAEQYGLTGVPETYIIDAGGIVREKIIGPMDWNSQGALSMLGRYLPQPSMEPVQIDSRQSQPGKEQ